MFDNLFVLQIFTGDFAGKHNIRKHSRSPSEQMQVIAALSGLCLLRLLVRYTLPRLRKKKR